MLKIKEINVKNVSNILIQIPGFLSKAWQLKQNEKLNMYLTEDGNGIIIKKAPVTNKEEDADKQGII